MLTRPLPAPTIPNWTTEQETIFGHACGASDNIMISALAGCGKTTTIEQVQLKSKIKPILYLCFNKRNADEATDRMLSTTTVRTFNGMGHRIWGSNGRSLTLDFKKTATILRGIINESPKSAQSDLWASWDQVVSGVSLAKSLGYVPPNLAKSSASLITQSAFHSHLDERPDDLVSDLIDEVVRCSIGLAYKGTIDFNDQVYMPALFGGTFPKFPLVMVDEYQDLSPVNHALLSRLVAGRIIGVGDPWQNIYGFRGAKAGGMDEAKLRFRMTELDLSVSFRCPRAIVEHVQWRVPHFKWINEGGSVHVADRILSSGIPDIATVICRNNAPLFGMAFKLIGAGYSVSVAGSDIGPRLVAIMKRLGDDSMTRAQTLSAINDWEAEKLAKESRNAPDMAECMRIFARQGDGLSQAISYAEHLFKQQGSIKLMTGHKSKGLEFDHVIHLDPWLCADTEQDQNLRYVISTRSRDKLIEVDSNRIEW
jgi:DNA helicase-2/ATP-dependent DNA helicase PcrA